MIYASIIICTRNRADSLALTLDSLTLAIHNAPEIATEVILVNNGSTDNTEKTIKQWAESTSFHTVIVSEERKGLSFARNAGLKATNGEIIVFTDDDCTLNPDYLTILKNHYKNDTVPLIRGGMVKLGDPSDLLFTIKLDEHPHRITNIDHPGGFIIGANMTMHRDATKKIGLFDERFGAGAPFIAAEETDYIYRCQLQKIPVEYVPDLIVYHFHGRKEKKEIISLSNGYHIGGGALYAKYIFKWNLLRHLYWDSRKCLAEIFMKGDILNKDLGISYKSLIKANIKGMLLFWSKKFIFRNKGK